VRRLLGIAVSTAGLLCPASPSAQQSPGCSGFSAYKYAATGTEVLHFTAEILRGNCNGVYAESWVDQGAADACTAGLFVPTLGSCWDSTFSEGDRATATLRKYTCGPVLGHAHFGVNWGSMGQSVFFELTPQTQPVTVPCRPAPPDEYCTYEWNYELEQWQCMSPIIIATGNSQQYKLTSAEEGVSFDMNGDGVPTRIGWTSADSDVAFLIWDRDGDGVIPPQITGKDLLGNFTHAGAPNGFMALYELLKSQTGVAWQDRLTSDDALFHRLYLWTDRNHDAVVDEGEIRPFGEQFSAIMFAAGRHNRKDGHGNRFAWEGTVLLRTAPGNNPTKHSKDSADRRRRVYDVFFTGPRG
jgi:hypothetical protein